MSEKAAGMSRQAFFIGLLERAGWVIAVDKRNKYGRGSVQMIEDSPVPPPLDVVTVSGSGIVRVQEAR